MKLISWNVNGLRALHRKGNFADVFEYQPDILFLQETKAEPSQLPEQVKEVTGYHSHFASSKVKKGYSGVAIYVKQTPDKVEYGMGIKKFDDEGRIVTVYLDKLVLLCIYFPNGGGGPERLQYKLDFYDAFLEHIEKLRARGLSVIFGGDINTAHEEIDLAPSKHNEDSTGFLPEERAWMDEVINLGYIDTFRHFNPTKAGAYSHWDMRVQARDQNIGWRFDYFFVSPDLRKRLKSASILSGVFGSDHCPVQLELA